MLVLCLLAFAVGAAGFTQGTWSLPPPALTPYQRARLDSIEGPARAASQAAEGELQKIFAGAEFRQLLAVDDEELALLSPEELLSQVKSNLETVEFTFAFGANPEQPLPYAVRNISTYDEWGFLPNNWQLKASLQSTKGTYLWETYDAAEVNLYGLKPYARREVVTNATVFPTLEEAAERPLYALMSFRRIDLGFGFFGPYQFVYRNGMVRSRAELLPSDSGIVEVCCNKSIEAPAEMRKGMCGMMKASHLSCELASTPPPQRPGMELDALLRNVKITAVNNNSTVAEVAAKTVWQIVSPNANHNMGEQLQIEAAVLGAVTTADVKLVVADFTDLFGTQDGDNLLQFCQRHKLPLAWSGSPHYNPQDPSQPCGPPRYLDPASGAAANATSPSEGALALWSSVEEEVREFRANQPKTGWQEQMATFWRKLGSSETSVLPVRAGDCSDTDLCFGTQSKDGVKRCVCRRDPGSFGPAEQQSATTIVV